MPCPGETGGNTTKQIISLGAGTDTRYFRLRANNRHQDLVYHEFDFPDICEAKIRTIETKVAAHFVADAIKVNKEGYFCHPLDLRQLPSQPEFSFPGFQPDVGVSQSHV